MATHRFHEVGRTECVTEGCEPQISSGTTLPGYEAATRSTAHRLGGGPRAWAAARRITEARG